MKRTNAIAILLILSALFGAPLAVRACPLCADAIADANANSSEDETDNFPAAMNQSIYMMLAVPYSALCVVGFCVYRGVKQNEAYRLAACGLTLTENPASAKPQAATSAGEPSCPLGASS